MACSCLCSPLFHASDLNFQLIYNTSARIPSFGSAWADRKQRKQLSHTKPSLTVSLNYLCVFVFICPTKQVCISLASDTPQRASTGTAQRGSSGNTWLPEASPHSCIFFLCQFSADEMLKKKEVIFLRSCLSDSHFPLTTRLTDTITAERQRTQLYLRQPSLQHQHPPLDHSCTTQTGWLTRRKQKPPAPQLLCRAPAPQGSPVSWGESVCFSTTCWHRRGRGWHATLSHILSDLAELILLLCC